MGRYLYLSLFFVLVFINANAQTGEIRGRVLEKGGKEGVPFASVAALHSGDVVLATVTDLDGNFTLKPLTPGKYDIKATSVGYSPAQVSGVLVIVDKISFANIEMSKGIELKAVEVTEYKIPLLDKGQTAVQKTTTYEEIQAAPLRDINSIASQSAGVFQRDEGREINIRGSRSDATSYYVDGIKVTGNTAVSSKAAEQITVITGGIPAQYGDATGGIISITTRGPSSKFAGGIEGESSTLLDAYNNDRLSFSVSGPIYSKRDEEGKKSTKLGFFAAGDWLYDLDPNPSSIGAYKVKEDILADIQNNPIIKSPIGAGFDRRPVYFTYDSLEHVKARQNVSRRGYTLNAKLDFKPAKNLDFSFGGSHSNRRFYDFIDIYSLMNYKENGFSTDNTYRVFGKVTQRFGDSQDQSKTASVIKNAYYTVQFDYTKNKSIDENERHKDKLFRYGHLGQFTTYKADAYLGSIEDTLNIGGNQYIGSYNSYLYNAIDTQYSFSIGEYNPITAANTAQYYTLAPSRAGFYQNSTQVVQNGGLLNGDNRLGLQVYGLWATPGRLRNFYGKSETEQYRITASGSADIKNHEIRIGMEYEQRIERSWSVNPSSLWSLMRLLANSPLVSLDLDNPDIVFDTNGDTLVYYNWLYNPTQNDVSENAKGFYENVRDRFGVAYNRFIDIDNIHPDKYSLDLFTADELLDNGLIGYYGYDYLGEKTKSNPSLTDFLNNKDATNNFTRSIGAFQPIYIAGYIQDKFTFNDIIFNIGLRIDRFDANQPVLKDKYLLYPAYTAGSDVVKNHPTIRVPGNIGNDYVVYVDNIQNPTRAVGFRNGDDWYDSQGNFTSDVTNIANASGTGIAPYIQREYLTADENNTLVAQAFGDYEPQTTYMPRIAFSFPISDEAYFAAHYDILTQRPQSTGLLRFNPTSYRALAQGLGGNLSNPSLLPEKTTDYEITFQQKLSRSSSLSLSAFYKELRNQIQIINVTYAYPIDYSTYGNIDFGTVKGLTLSYDLRRTNNVRLSASYTLQFANGTGSSPFTNSGLLAQQGQTNLREPKPLDFDRRHTLVASVDYHYGSGKDYNGPVIKNKQVLADAGINLTFRAGSGTPYTRKSNITPMADFTTAANGRSQLAGSINGSRLPWEFRVDAKVDKSFPVKVGKKADGEYKKVFYMNVYVQALNLFDAQNIISVYAATGSPSDDGYLASAGAQDYINSQISPQAYRDLYEIAADNQGSYSLPRRIRLGLQINF